MMHKFNDECEWRLFGFETATIIWKNDAKTGGEMCQMTCCIGLDRIKYVAVLAKKEKGSGMSFGMKAWCQC